MFEELTDWQEYAKIFAGLYAMVNPVAALPVFIGATRDHDAKEMRRTAAIAALTLIGVLVVFELSGEAILDTFGITLDAFQIAGGILLLMVALQLMGGNGDSDPVPAEDRHLVGVVPLGIPLLAGPAAISSVVVFGQEHPGPAHDVLVIAAIFGVSALSYLIFRAGPTIEKRVSAVAMMAFTRIMGLIVAAIAVEFIIDGLAGHFPGWLGPDGVLHG